MATAGIQDSPENQEEPVRYVERKGRRLGFYCLAEHEFNYKDDFSATTVLCEPARNILEIQRARKNCDALIVFSHVGPEITAWPSPRMVALFRCFAEAGASAVVNTHAHHVMGMEVHQNVPILYGLGNFLFPLESPYPSWYQGMAVKLMLDEGLSMTAQPVFTKFSADKAEISLDASPERQREFQEISAILQDPTALDAKWKEFCISQQRHILKEMAKGCLAMMPHFFRNRLWKNSGTVAPGSYFAKGTRMLRGMFQCENHADVLARIFRDLEKG